VLPFEPDEFVTAILDVATVTNAAQSSSLASVIAYQDTAKFDDLFGIGWQTYGGNLPLTLKYVKGNYADLGKPPPMLSYYLGYAAAQCLVAAVTNENAPKPCNTIFDGFYTPLVRIFSAARGLRDALWNTCTLNFGYDPPVPLTAASLVVPTPLSSSIMSKSASPSSTPAAVTPKPTQFYQGSSAHPLPVQTPVATNSGLANTGMPQTTPIAPGPPPESQTAIQSPGSRISEETAASSIPLTLNPGHDPDPSTAPPDPDPVFSAWADISSVSAPMQTISAGAAPIQSSAIATPNLGSLIANMGPPPAPQTFSTNMPTPNVGSFITNLGPSPSIPASSMTVIGQQDPDSVSKGSNPAISDPAVMGGGVSASLNDADPVANLMTAIQSMASMISGPSTDLSDLMHATTAAMQQDPTAEAFQNSDPTSINQAVPTSAQAGGLTQPDGLHADLTQNLMSAIQNVNHQSLQNNPAFYYETQSASSEEVYNEPTAAYTTAGQAISGQTVPYSLLTTASGAGLMQELMSAVQVVGSVENKEGSTVSATTQSTGGDLAQSSVLMTQSQAPSWSTLTEGSQLSHGPSSKSYQQPTHAATTTIPPGSANTDLPQNLSPTIQRQGTTSQLSGVATHTKAMLPPTSDAAARFDISLPSPTCLVLLISLF